MMLPGRSSAFSLRRMNASMVIWKPCTNAAWTSAFPDRLFDNHTIFRSPKTGMLTVDELIAGKTVHLTQFGRSMHELGLTSSLQKHLRQKDASNAYGRLCRAGFLLSSQSGASRLCQKQTVFWKPNTGNSSIRSSLSPEAESILFLYQKGLTWIPFFA